MSRKDNENTIYVYLDRFVDGVVGTYRQLEDVLGIDQETIRRIVKESTDISAVVHGKGNNKETRFTLVKNETKTNGLVSTKKDVFKEPKETKEITFNTRQHKLCDYLISKLKIHNEYLDKVEILFDLEEYYFAESDDIPWKEDVKKSRHNYGEYVQLTNDVTFINLHGEVRQVMIGSKGGPKGGIKALRVGEQYDAIEKILSDALKKFNKFHSMKKAAEKQANTILVFKSEKSVMDILRQFDNK